MSSSENLSQALLEWWDQSGSYNVSMTIVNNGLNTYAYKNMTGLADYTYSYRVWAENTTGSWNVTDFMYVQVDTTPPVISIISPQNGSEYVTRSILLNVSVSDATLANISYEVDGNGTVYQLCNDCSDAYTYVSIPSDGEHNITVYAIDSAFNQNSTTVYFRIGATPIHIFAFDVENQSIAVKGFSVGLDGESSAYGAWDSDNDGEVVLSVDSTQSYNVTCSADGYEENVTTGVSFQSTTTFTCYLAGNRSISGSVVDIENESVPVVNATIRLINLSNQMLLYTTKTDESGAFSINVRGGTNYTLEVSADDFVPYEVNLTKEQDYLLNIKMYERGRGSISLIVVDAQSGRPIPNARVYAYYGTTLNFSATTNSSGYAQVFVNVEPPTTSYKIRVEHPDYETVNDNTVHDVREGEDVFVGEYSTYGKAKIYGRLVDEFNQALPVEHALVELYRWSGGLGDKLGYDNRYFYNTTSNKTGWWVIHAPVSLINTYRYAIKVTQVGYQTRVFDNNGNGYNGSGMVGDSMSMRGKIHINGTVYDATNLQPLSSVMIRVEETNISSYPYSSLTIYQTGTDENGYFEMYIRANDNYTLSTPYNDTYPGSRGYATFTAMLSGTSFEQNISLKGALNLSGRVIDVNRDSNGDVIPIANVDIGLCYYADYAGKTYCYNTTSDEQGRFSISIRSSYDYHAIFDGTSEGYGINDSVSFNYGDGNHDLGDVVLYGTTLLTGTVKDASQYVVGTPYIDGAKITVLDETKGLNYTTYSTNGYYAIYLPAGRNISAVIEKNGYKPYITTEDTITLRNALINKNFYLIGETHIDGRVADAENPDIPLKDAHIVIYTTEGTPIYNISVNETGRFAADLGVTSNYYLNIATPGYDSANYSCGTSYCSPYMDLYNLVLQLYGSAVISGEIKDAYTDEYLHNATVILSYLGTNQTAYTKTGIDGNFFIRVDSTKLFSMTARQLGYLSWISDNGGAGYSGNVSLTGGNAIKLEAIFEARVYDYFSMAPIYNATVSAYINNGDNSHENYTGLPITRVNISVSCENDVDGSEVWFNKTACSTYQEAEHICNFTGTLSNGEVVFSKVPVGSYRLFVNATQAGCGTHLSVVDIDQSDAGTTISIPVTMTVVSLLVNITDDHSYVEGANVTLWQNGGMAKDIEGNYLTGLTNSSGLVLFQNMYPGQYDITVEIPAEGVTTSLQYTVESGYNYLHLDALPPKITGVKPENDTTIKGACSSNMAIDFEVNTSESSNISVKLWSPDNPSTPSYQNSQLLESHQFTLDLGCGEWYWNITVCDSSANCNVTDGYMFTLIDNTFTVVVYDEEGNAVDDGVNVTISNETYSIRKETSNGRAVFDELVNDSNYNITVNGSMLGYGENITLNFRVLWGSSLDVELNITTLLVNVTNSSGYAVANANVTLWVDALNNIPARDAFGNVVNGLTNASGVVYFKRLLPCKECNLTIDASGTNKDESSSFVSQIINISAGNHTYVHVDPPSASSLLYTPLDPGVNHTVYIEVYDEDNNPVSRGVNVSLVSINSGIIYSNATNASGVATLNVTSGAYRLVIDGSEMGYGRANSSELVKVGLLSINRYTTDASGIVRMPIDGQAKYYIRITAPGYVTYDSNETKTSYYGSYLDDVSAGYGINPRVTYYLNGSATVKGRVFDKYFVSTSDPRYRLANATIKLVDMNTGEIRYQAKSNSSGEFYMRVSPYPSESGASNNRIPYSISVEKEGYVSYIDDNSGYGIMLNDGQTLDLSVGLTGEGVFDAYLYDVIDSQPIDVVEHDVNLTLKDADGVWMYSSNDFEKSGNHLQLRYNPNYAPLYVELHALDYNTSLIFTGPFYGTHASVTYVLYPDGYGGLHLIVLDGHSQQPVENATIKVCKRINSNACVNAETNSSGEALLYLLQPITYDITVNGSGVGYGVNSSPIVNQLATTTTERIYLQPNVLKLDFVSDENESVRLNVSLTSELANYSFTNVTNITIYRIPTGNYTLQYDVPSYYKLYNESDKTINYITPGTVMSRTVYFNETQYLVELTNGSSGVSGIDVYLYVYHNKTNSSGALLFRKVIPGNYSLLFNKTQVYVAGYFPPENMSAEVLPGKDAGSGNYKQILLNSTDGYGIVRAYFLQTFVDGAKAELIYNDSVVVDSKVFDSEEGNDVFLLANISLYNTSLRLKVTKSGYNDFISQEFDLQNKEVKEIGVTLTLQSSESSSNGYSSGGGGTSYSSSASGGPSASYVPATSTSEKTEYDVDIETEPQLTVELHSCTQASLKVTNTGNAAITQLHIKESSTEKYSIIPSNAYVEVLNPGENATIPYTICANDIVESVPITILSDQLARTVLQNLQVTVPSPPSQPRYDVSALNQRINSIKNMLAQIPLDELPEEGKEMYYEAYRSIQNAEESMRNGDYATALYQINRAESIINDIQQNMAVKKMPVVNREMIIVSAIVLIVGIAAYYIIRTRLRHQVESVRNIQEALKERSSKPVRPASTLETKTEKVYYTRPITNDEFIAKIVKTIESIERCEKCGMKLINGRCLRCS